MEIVDKVASYSQIVFGSLLLSEDQSSQTLIDLREELADLGRFVTS